MVAKRSAEVGRRRGNGDSNVATATAMAVAAVAAKAPWRQGQGGGCGEGDGVGERMKSTREKKGQNKSPCCVSWGDETRAVSHEKTRQGSTPRHAKTSLEGIQKQSHVAKPCGQKIQKIPEDMFKWPKDM